MDRADLFEHLTDIRTGMVGLNGRHMPMSHMIDDEAIYFITAQGTDVAEAAAARATGHYIICSDAEGFYADIKGRFVPVTDKAKIDALWNPISSAWFEEGKEDPDLRVVVFHPTEAEMWKSPSAPVFFYQIAKANLTATLPNTGTRVKLTF